MICPPRRIRYQRSLHAVPKYKEAARRSVRDGPPEKMLDWRRLATSIIFVRAAYTMNGTIGGNPAEQLALTGEQVVESLGVDLSTLHPAIKRLIKLSTRPWWFGPLGAQAVQLGGASLAVATRNPRFGLVWGARMPFGSRGVLDYLMRSAGTLREVTDILARFLRPLTFDYLDWKLHEEEACAGLFAHLSFELKMHPVLVDYRIVREVSLWRLLLGDPAWSPHEIRFCYPRPASTQLYRELLGDARLCFDTERFGFRFATELLDRPLPQRDDQLRAILLQHVEHLLTQLKPESSLTAELEELLVKMLHQGKPSGKEVARRLGMSERTLRRRLEAEGETYQAVLDRTRAKLAKLYLDAPAVRTKELAQRLGFESGSSLRRAYERWTGAELESGKRLVEQR